MELRESLSRVLHFSLRVEAQVLNQVRLELAVLTLQEESIASFDQDLSVSEPAIRLKTIACFSK